MITGEIFWPDSSQRTTICLSAQQFGPGQGRQQKILNGVANDFYGVAHRRIPSYILQVHILTFYLIISFFMS